MTCKRDAKYDVCPEMYKAGLSIQDIANYFEVTRQAMHKILTRRGVKFRDNKKYGADNHFHRGGYRQSDRAQNMCEYAVRKGVIIPEPCEICGAFGQMRDGKNKVQAHHDDYNKPLEIRWLCQKCHHEWHKYNKSVRRI